jgi:hypothetical protein
MEDEMEKQDQRDECMMHNWDSQGDPNLCCCYIVDSDGRFEDACYRPVSGCC